MGELIDMFSGKEIPATEDSEFAAEFYAEHWGAFINALDGMSEAENEQHFVSFMREVKRLVRKWPTPPR